MQNLAHPLTIDYSCVPYLSICLTLHSLTITQMLLLWATHVAFTTLCNIQSEKLSCCVTNKGNCNRVSSKNDIFQKRTCNVADLMSITHLSV